ncbi:ABC transporter ATP-binding protein [Ruminococcus sp.]|uniref:ABC transporter ATP-binding protein n=1 Tax=Ruminococcus sp. TaxID=41978 RepID=UPI0025E0901A|nr:ABC transporter ATP-binding protein [Ruminococcus sp.]MCR4638613.1 ABC transporter ATP-binding protein [Ruminococcus sp.]
MIDGRNITKLFGETGLKSMDIKVKKGEMAGLSGSSGCGKSTLLNILTGMLRPDSGTILIGGVDISKLSEKKRTALRGNVIGYMMQKNALLPELTVMQNIIFPAYIAKKHPTEKDAEEIAEKLSLTKQLGSYPSQLSGGEYRRGMLARILLLDTPVIVADEPTSNLDRESAVIVRDILTEANKNGVTVLAASHDQLLLDSADRVIAVG